MKKTLSILFTIIYTLSFSQSVKITAYKKQAINNLFKYEADTISFPVIIAKTDSISRKINAQISATFIEPAYETKPFEIGLDSAIKNGLINLSYEVTYNRNNILSITINAEGCGAYCSSWQTFFNFTISTGNAILITDLIKKDKQLQFKGMVLKRKTEALNAYKKDIAESLKNNEVDIDTYTWALQEVDSNCIEAASLDRFFLSADELEVVDDCPLPHAIRFIEPSYKLNYTYTELKGFLNPEWELF